METFKCILFLLLIVALVISCFCGDNVPVIDKYTYDKAPYGVSNGK